MSTTQESSQRRERVARMYSEGTTIREIAATVGRPVGTVSCDLSLMRQAGHPLVSTYRKESAAKTGFGRGGNGKQFYADTLPTYGDVDSPNIDALRNDFKAYLRHLNERIAELLNARDTVEDVVRILEANDARRVA